VEHVVIVGTGPDGLSAAIYAARADPKTLVVEGSTTGGQLIVSHQVGNDPRSPEAISGMELMKLFKKQAERFGDGFPTGGVATVKPIDSGSAMARGPEPIGTRTVIIAAGSQARRLPIPSVAKFYGKGISGCATCDGAFFRDQDVIVVGGGNTAVEDAVSLTRFARSVTIVHRCDHFRAAPVEVEKAKSNPKIKWMIPWVVQEIAGDNPVTGATLRNAQTGEMQHLACDGIFVAIGHDPRTEICRDLVECDEHGFVRIEPWSTRTSAPGIFACGDVCGPVYKRAVVASGTGFMTALDAQKNLDTRHI
jgi:thioredoxin reductase (NADPH)